MGRQRALPKVQSVVDPEVGTSSTLLWTFPSQASNDSCGYTKRDWIKGGLYQNFECCWVCEMKHSDGPWTLGWRRKGQKKETLVDFMRNEAKRLSPGRDNRGPLSRMDAAFLPLPGVPPPSLYVQFSHPSRLHSNAL